MLSMPSCRVEVLAESGLPCFSYRSQPLYLVAPHVTPHEAVAGMATKPHWKRYVRSLVSN